VGRPKPKHKGKEGERNRGLVKNQLGPKHRKKKRGQRNNLGASRGTRTPVRKTPPNKKNRGAGNNSANPLSERGLEKTNEGVNKKNPEETPTHLAGQGSQAQGVVRRQGGRSWDGGKKKKKKQRLFSKAESPELQRTKSKGSISKTRQKKEPGPQYGGKDFTEKEGNQVISARQNANATSREKGKTAFERKETQTQSKGPRNPRPSPVVGQPTRSAPLAPTLAGKRKQWRWLGKESQSGNTHRRRRSSTAGKNWGG